MMMELMEGLEQEASGGWEHTAGGQFVNVVCTEPGKAGIVLRLPTKQGTVLWPNSGRVNGLHSSSLEWFVLELRQFWSSAARQGGEL